MELKINDLKWQVEFLNKNDKRLISDGDKCLGRTFFNDLDICLRNNMPKTLARRTVIHELVHAFLYSYNVTLPSDEDKAEEIFCDFIGSYLSKIHRAADKIMSFYSKEVK